MALDELPDAERACSNCGSYSCHGMLAAFAGKQAKDCASWNESSASVRVRAEKRIAELEAHVVQLRKLCADRPNLDHIPNQSVDIEHWFYMIDCAARGGR